MILNRAKEYYKNDKERLRKKARNKHRNLSEEEKKQNMAKIDIIIKEKKQKLKEYQKEYQEKTRDKNNMFEERNA